MLLMLFGLDRIWKPKTVEKVDVEAGRQQAAQAAERAQFEAVCNGSEGGGQLTCWTGNKFPGGFGPTEIPWTDYWALRQRSAAMFKQNMYARGIIRRLVTNIINTGIFLEATPDEETLGMTEDSLNEWTDDVENRFQLWADDPNVCDYNREKTWAQIQLEAKREAYIEGDILVILRINRRTRMPSYELVAGGSVQTPLLSEKDDIPDSHEIRHGVELDSRGRQVAYWIRQADGSSKRVSARGRRTGRRMAWLLYGTDKRMDEVRGEPLLSIVLQSLKELDRYRDAVLRKAVVNSMLAMFIQKGEERMGTLPIDGGSVARGTTTITDGDSKQRTFSMAQQIPGVVFQELQFGETPQGFKSEVDLDMGKFETAIIHAIAWANEMPPEILTLSFEKNYSASAAAINEFKMFQDVERGSFGASFCQPGYIEWLVTSVLLRKIKAVGFLESWRNPTEYETYGAWVSADWYGSVKPSTDMLKIVKAYELAIELGLTTRGRASRELYGVKFEKNIKKLKRENELLVEARRPLAEFEQEFNEPDPETVPTAQAEATLELVNEAIDEKLEDASATA